MRRGRPRLAGTEEERADARRARVRLHVQAFRQRQKDRSSTNHVQAAPSSGQLTIIVENPGLRDRKKKDVTSSTGKSSNDDTDHHVKPCDPTLQTIALVNQQTLPQTIDEGQSYRGAFFSALLETYQASGNKSLNNKGLTIEGRYEQEPIPDTAELWIFKACFGAGMCGAESALDDALLSLALGMVGARQSEMQLITAGRRTYQKALAKIARSLNNMQSIRQSTESQPGILAAACLACAWVELMANRSSDNFERHLDGIACLFESCDIAVLEHPFTRSVFLDHRGTYISFCFLSRKSSFYSQPKWIEYQQSTADRPEVNCYDSLLNIAYPLTGLMEDYDLGVYCCVKDLRELARSLLEAVLSMDEWRNEMEESFLVPVMSASPSANTPPFPEQISYASVSAALYILYYSAFKIHIYLMLLDITEDLQRYNDHVAKGTSKNSRHALECVVIDCATTVCSSIDFCLSPDSGLFGHTIALFPFDAAWQVFLRLNKMPEYDMSKEMEFCDRTANRFTQMGLALLRQRSGT